MKSDVESSSDLYAERFSGEVGEWFLEKQLSIVESMLGSKDESILDVGGGHAQLANPLSAKGFNVTVAGSDPVCSKRLNSNVKFVAHDLYHLPFPDKSFDTVLCFRLISHSPEWKQLISELCRVSRKRVILDYPNQYSLNLFTPLFFRIKRKLEGTTRPYRMFLKREVNEVFRDNKFKPAKSEGQYFLPMILYKTLQSRSFAEKIEGFFSRLKLQAYSSPVIAAWIDEFEKLSTRL